MTIYEGAAYVSSPYGWRNHPITGARSHHNGKDIVGQKSKKQRLVVAKGRVLAVNTGYQGGRGNNVVIQSVGDAVRPGADVRLRYQHQAATTLKVGQQLALGDVVGTEGSTGDSTGSHCHFEVTVNGAVVDPSPWDGLPNKVGLYAGNNGAPAGSGAAGGGAGAGSGSGASSGSVAGSGSGAGSGAGAGAEPGGGAADKREESMVEVFCPKGEDLEIFTRPNVEAVVPGAAGTGRWPAGEYAVYQRARLGGVSPALDGVRLKRPGGGFGWAALLAGRYALTEVPLEAAEARGLVGAGGGADALKTQLEAETQKTSRALGYVQQAVAAVQNAAAALKG